MSVISRLKVVIEANSAALRQELAKAKADTRKFSKSTNRRMKDIQRSAMQAGAALGSAFAVQGITRRADEMTQMASKLDVVTGSSAGTAAAMSDVKRIAHESRSELGAVGTLYTRMAIATKNLNMQQGDLAKITQVVSDTFILSGTTASEAANSARQFAQGLASGRLQGDELRSVMENNIYLANLMADGLGVTTGELRDMGANGELTAEKLVSVLGAAFQDTRDKAGNMTKTMAQAWTQMDNKFTIMIGKADKITGFSEIAVNGITYIAENLEHFGKALLVAATFMIPTLISALWSLTLAMYANPFISFAAAAVTAGFFISKNWNTIINFLHKSFTVTLPNAFDTLRIGLWNMAKGMYPAFNFILEKLEGFINGAIDLYNQIADRMPWLFDGNVSQISLTLDTKGVDTKIAELEKKIENREANYSPFKPVGEEGSNAESGESPTKPMLEGWEAASESLKGIWDDLTGHYGKMNADMLGADKNTWGEILEKASGNSEKLKKIHKGLGVVSATVSMYEGISAALADKTMPTFARYVAAAKVAAVGAANITSIGQAHDGLDNVPREGTYLLDEGERVVGSRLNKDLSEFIARGGKGGGNTGPAFSPQVTFAVNGVNDPEQIKRALRENRGTFESIMREIHSDHLASAPF